MLKLALLTKMASPEALTPQNFRLVDASLNRAAEGLRYLEDVARFLLNDPALTKRLKLLRHNLLVSDWHFQKQLLEFRDATDDVGLGINIAAEKENKRDLMSSIVANSRRAQEALRTLEEFSKISNYSTHLSANKLEKARFDLYTIEKELAGKMLRQDKTDRLRGIYVIIDIQALNGRSHLDVALQAISGGASVIQLRDKTLDHGKLLPIARDLKKLCSNKNVLYIINDYIDIALAVQADGIHLGQTDLPVTIARKMVPIDMIIGCSTDTVTQAKRAVANGADYVAVGAIFPTPSKDTEIIGLKALSKIKQAVRVPVVAIGGINKTNIAEVKLAGADAAAVISAVMGAASPEKVVRELTRKFEAVK
jgi:thiamine-phosphate pyrophosphorylase